MNKRAITPLISTFLLLVFATGLGAVVMSWGNTYAKVEKKEVCSKVSLNVIYIQSQPSVCFSEGNLFYTIQNVGDIEIQNYRISLIGNIGIQNIDVSQNIPLGEIIKSSTPFESSLVGQVQKVIFIPRVSSNTVMVLCPKNSAEVDFVGEC